MWFKKRPAIALSRLKIYLMVVVITALMAGCASTGPETPSASFKDETQTTRHWDLIAKDVAAQIHLALENAGIYEPVPIYLKTSDETPFGKTFRNLLTNQLEKLGIAMVWKETDAVLFIDNTVIVVCQNQRRVTDPLSGTFEVFTDLSETMVVARSSESQALASDDQSMQEKGPGEPAEALPPTEIIVTTLLASEVDYLMQNSDIYYISDPDFQCHWVSPLVQEEVTAPTTPEISEQADEQISEEISEQPPEEIMEPISDQKSTEASEKMPEQISEEMPEQAPEDIAEQVSSPAPIEVPQEAPEQIPEEAPGQAPEDIAEQIPYPTPMEVPGETAEQKSEQVFEPAPDQISEQIPEQYKKPIPTVKVKGLN